MDYLTLTDDLVIYNMDWQTFLSMYGYANEYEALNDTDTEKQIYNRTAKKRIDLIHDFTTLYNKLYLPENDIYAIHKTTHKTSTIMDKFIDKVISLIEQKEKFFSYINYELVRFDVEDLNKILKSKKTNKERFDYLKGITGNIYTTLQTNPNVDFRDYFIIKDTRKVKCSSYLNGKGISRNTYFSYKRKKSFYKGSFFYLELAFF